MENTKISQEEAVQTPKYVCVLVQVIRLPLILICCQVSHAHSPIT